MTHRTAVASLDVSTYTNNHSSAMTPLVLSTDDKATIAAFSLDACAALTLDEGLCSADSVSDIECAAIERILSDFEHASAAIEADWIERYQQRGSHGEAMAEAPLPLPTAVNHQPVTAAAAPVDASTLATHVSTLAADTASQAPEQQQHQSTKPRKRSLRPRATNTSRARQLREMQTLREEIAALTDTLARSQQHHKQEHQQCQQRLAASWTSVSTPLRQSQELQRTASRARCETERERLTRARREHQQLRRRVRDQMRLMARFECAVTKRTARAAVRPRACLFFLLLVVSMGSTESRLTLTQRLLCSTHFVSPQALMAEHALLQRRHSDAPRRHVSAGLTLADQRIFAQTVADIGAMYASADRDLTALLQQTERLALAPLDDRSDASGGRAWHVLCDAAHAPTRIEVVACEEVPFCKAAVDHCLRLTRWEKRPVERLFGAEHYSGLTDVVVTKECVRFGASDAVAHLASHAFVDHGRSIYVGVAYISPRDDDVDNGDDCTMIPRGCVLRAQSWIVLTPRERSTTLVHSFASMTPVAAASLSESAVNQTLRAVPDVGGDTTTRPTTATPVARPCVFAPGSERRVVSEWTRIHATRQQCLENLLLAHQATV